jgi:hypothetical protein
MNVSAQAENEFVFLIFLSYSGLQCIGQYPSHWGGPYNLFSSPFQKLVSSRNTLTVIPRSHVYHMCGYPLAQSSPHIKLTITSTKLEMFTPLD